MDRLNVYLGKAGRATAFGSHKRETAALIAKRGTALLAALKDGQPRLLVPLGMPLQSWNYVNLSTNTRETLLAGFSEFLFHVWTAAVSPSVPTCKDQKPTLTKLDGGLRRSLMPDHGNTMTALKHGDLNAWNVLVEMKQALRGKLGYAQLLPLAAAVQHPLFIADIPGWQIDNVPPEMIFDDDRTELERIIDRLAIQKKQFFEMSLQNMRISAEYTRVKLSLGKFIRSNLDLQSDSGVLPLQTRLCCLPEDQLAAYP
ncbi:hypothetical protein F5Y12DRAFT_789230 [Xylaria sp. FL1777]|nr:hypothetical protein F5Y12DRAFT_789230 [Xylaria sp. FL1777]